MISLGDLQIWTGNHGLDIYEEIHQNENNRLLHTAFLPFVFYGIYRGLGSLGGTKPFRSAVIILSIILLYGSYYHLTGVSTSLETVLTNIPLALLAFWKLQQKGISQTRHFLVSMAMLVGALVLQEVVGHSLWEEVNSRMTASYVLNAVMYSPVFYAQNILNPNYLPLSIMPMTFLLIWETLY